MINTEPTIQSASITNGDSIDWNAGSATQAPESNATQNAIRILHS